MKLTELENIPRPIVAFKDALPRAHFTPPHTHQRGHLLYAYEGVITVETPQREWVAPPERAIWIPAGVKHSSHSIGEVKNIGLFLYPDICNKLPSNCSVVGISLLLRALLEEATLLDKLYEEDGRDGLLMRLLLCELEKAPLIPISIPMPMDDALALLCRQFLKQPVVSITIDQWAAKLNMHRKRFTRYFKRETGMSFAEWRQEACITVAIQKLAAGESVTSVAFALGYDSAASFSTMFKKRLGTSPSRFITNT